MTIVALAVAIIALALSTWNARALRRQSGTPLSHKQLTQVSEHFLRGIKSAREFGWKSR